jgi:hypothetical protein
MMIRILIISILATLALTQVDPPVWPEVFKQAFVESYNSTHLHVSGTFYFDAKRGTMRLDRHDGIHEAVCGSVLPNVSTSCTQLIRDKKRYIVFPERRTCCMCCDAAHGCGILKRDWLATAKYEGEETLSGEPFYKWSIADGAATDLYYATKSTERIPRRLNSAGQQIQDFIMNTFSTDPLPESIFALPSYCNSTCPATTVCGKFQM